ncbi:excinuclease ABC subunit UvrC [Flavobacteriaceae bacterium]|nr:excinuclease ABC subunit UvrC [Cryomorphaceae bacterium]MDB3967606.1 excinuclease ABC subunit UvrC [Flavobacteriaceae bacterium]MBT3688766.1 excinuclease ABC subunit UvrC [Cryomorphaceae bacterium]MBT4222204.1 excinuclease ABC subunit UvrC [Cryomorphaceae bacterium]MBT4293889.1 excinuclease ABC subunit UvrC [Cryomorphaceae bacterium]
MKQSELHIQSKSLPELPGVYQFYDDKKIIYIGKAKNLKKRVSSYFTKNHDNKKTKLLVKSIRKIEKIIVDTEMDALLLENNLIKKYQPKYNILLKDDKSYPWICIVKEPIPDIFYTRKVEKRRGEYYGPFTNVYSARFLIKLIKDIYPFLNHELNHLIKKETEESIKIKFSENIKSIRNLIKGHFRKSIDELKEKMKLFSKNLKYEKAQDIKEKLEILYNYQAKSTIVNSKISDIDVFALISDESYAYINYLQISYGAVIRSFTLEVKKKLDESDKEILSLAVIELKQRFQSHSKEVVLPFKLKLPQPIKVTVPKTGDKKKLIELSERNAKFYRIDKLKQIKIIDPEAHGNRIMEQAKKDLQLKEKPIQIECFDNSNLMGTNPVASCVVFKNGKPSKKDYRHFKIQNIDGPNDFASMEQVIYRRLKRLLDENEALPNLIVVDGGKGQLSSGVNSLRKLNLENRVAIIGIAKKLEEIFKPNDKLPLYIDKKSETLKLIQQLRNEAHRFAINFHRDLRSKDALKSGIDGLKGVGPILKDKLLNKYKSFKRLKNADEEELIKFLGKIRGRSIFNQLRN